MEKIKEFIERYGSGYGWGYGYGSGYGWGDGSGYGYGSGYGSGYGWGDGSGYGRGDGCGDGCGDGYGWGNGTGWGISSFHGMEVYRVDGIATIITNVRGNIAKGYLLCDDLTLSPCYVAKGQNMFAHGETAKAAVHALQEKIYANMDADAAIETFIQEFPDREKKYLARAFYVWHHLLTGSCETGRDKFVNEHGIGLENDTFTVQEFIDITRNDYGEDVIRQLEKAWKETGELSKMGE